MGSVTTVGRIGDIVAMLPTLRSAGGKHDIFAHGSYMHLRINFIRTFLMRQSSVSSLRYGDKVKPDWRSENFRLEHHIKHTPLPACHAQHALHSRFIELLPDLSEPWVEAVEDNGFEKTVLIQRTARYNNPYFPWKSVVRHYGTRIALFGNDEEYEAFTKSYGTVRRVRFPDMLSLANAIKGCALFMGNQSFCSVLAEGLKVRRILECCLVVPDCVYVPSDLSQYVFDGSLMLPDVDGSGEMQVEAKACLPLTEALKPIMALRHSGHQSLLGYERWLRQL